MSNRKCNAEKFVGCSRTDFQPFDNNQRMLTDTLANRKGVNDAFLTTYPFESDKFVSEDFRRNALLQLQRIGRDTIALIKYRGFLYGGRTRRNPRDQENQKIAERIVISRALRDHDPILDVVELSSEPTFDPLEALLREKRRYTDVGMLKG